MSNPNPSWIRHFENRIAENIADRELRDMAKHLHHCGFGYENSNDLRDVDAGRQLRGEAWEIEAELQRRETQRLLDRQNEMNRSMGIG